VVDQFRELMILIRWSRSILYSRSAKSQKAIIDNGNHFSVKA